MFLYHILSQKRLQEKLSFAKEHGGRLMLTPHASSMDITGGLIPAYLHCLDTLVGSMRFSIKSDTCSAIRIELEPEARIYRYRGPQAEVSFDGLADSYDVFHTVYDNRDFVRWQEILLVNSRAVRSWTHAPDVIRHDFLEQLENLKNGEIPSERFFYLDITPEEQYLEALLIGKHIGVLDELPEPAEQIHRKMMKVFQRIGAV